MTKGDLRCLLFLPSGTACLPFYIQPAPCRLECLLEQHPFLTAILDITYCSLPLGLTESMLAATCRKGWERRWWYSLQLEVQLVSPTSCFSLLMVSWHILSSCRLVGKPLNIWCECTCGAEEVLLVLMGARMPQTRCGWWAMVNWAQGYLWSPGNSTCLQG